MPIVEALRKLYIKNVYSLARVEKLFADGYITAGEKRFILTGSYDETVAGGVVDDTDAGAGEVTD